VVFIMAALMVRTGGDDDPEGPGALPRSSTAGGAGAGGCRPTDADQRIPTTAPRDVQWQVFKVMALPRSASAGPMINQGQAARCYAHTPTGALMATAQLGFRYSVVDDWRGLSAQLIDNPGKKAFLARRAAERESVTPQNGAVAQIAGFRFVTYGPSTAVIQLAFRNPTQNTFISATYTVKWHDEDWMLELQPDGTANPDAQDLASLDGYTPWGGV
jgi:hypothetical protein